MTEEQALLEADRRRREAMIAADVATLATLLSHELVWTHSSGKTDDRDAFLKKIESQATRYHELHVQNPVVSSHGEVMICHGTLTGSATAGGRKKSLRNRFLSVWKKTGNGFELLAWQSTGF